MDEQQIPELTQKILESFQESKANLERSRRWYNLPLYWLVLRKIRQIERGIQDELAMGEYTYSYEVSLFSRIFRRPRL